MKCMCHKKKCPVEGCFNLISSKDRFCQDHIGLQHKASHKSHYNYRWFKLRNYFIKKHPICAKCGMPAQCVDHIKSIDSGGDVYKESNLMSLCNACHTLKTTVVDRNKQVMLSEWINLCIFKNQN